MQAAEGREFLPEKIEDVEFGKDADTKFEKIEREWFKEPVKEEKQVANLKKEGDKLNDMLGDMVSLAMGRPPEDTDKHAKVDTCDDDTANVTEASYEEENEEAHDKILRPSVQEATVPEPEKQKRE